MATKKKLPELDIPPEAHSGPEGKTLEILRLWWVDGDPAAMMLSAFDDPKGWGFALHMVADFASDMYVAQGKAESKEDVLRAIEEQFMLSVRKHRQGHNRAP